MSLLDVLFDIYPETITFQSVCDMFPPRQENAHKGDFGRLLCITGSERMPGAAAMSTEAALRCGAGLVTTATARCNIPALSARCPEAMYLPLRTDSSGFITWHGNEEILLDAIQKADAVLFGCGIGLTDETMHLLKNICRSAEGTLILDADGLNAAAKCIDILARRKSPLILTPHPGEMARLVNRSTKSVQQCRSRALRELCDALPHTVVVLKGNGTLIGCDKEYRKNTTGNPGMSRGGSGDVLAGMTAAFAAQGIKPADAAAAAVYIHGKAGDIAAEKFSQAAMLPRDIINCIPEVFLEIEKAVSSVGR